MADIMGIVNAAVIAKIPAITQISGDYFNSESVPEVMCRHDPAPLVKKKYFDGSFNAEFNFSFYVRAIDARDAFNLLSEIEGVIGEDSFGPSLSLARARFTVLSRPIPIDQEEDGKTTFTSSYKLAYFQEV